MKIGMNMLLWTTHVAEEHYPQLEKIKATGFDGVEIPIFGGDGAHYKKLRRKLDELQLTCSTVTVATPEASAISHPSFKALYDTFHANIEEVNQPKAFGENADAISHVHISNNDRGVPGRGHIDFPNIFKAIKASGYNGWLTIEAFGRALPDLVEPTRVWRDFFKSPDEVVVDGYKFIRETWDAA